MTTSGLHPHNGVALTLQTNSENGKEKKKKEDNLMIIICGQTKD